ncbi:hypothetical protein MMC25_000795 [Agyrium rufum]|nr:hypothetical protein [Agyrium rufum]
MDPEENSHGSPIQSEEVIQPGTPMTPTEVLNEFLSAHSIQIPSTRLPRKRQVVSTIYLSVIGLGSCGSVFAIAGTDLACKKAPNEKAFWNDYRLTNTVHNAFLDTRSILRKAFPERTIPQAPSCKEFSRHITSLLPDGLCFPPKHQKHGAVFTVDKIPSLPFKVRQALIEMYFGDTSWEEAMRSPENEDCLARAYLGARRSSPSEFDGMWDSLWNFPLKLDMMDELELDTHNLAIELAIALAAIHWKARVDGMDPEIVLGGAATRDSEGAKAFVPEYLTIPQEVRFPQANARPTHLWVLDFDKAATIELTRKDAKKQLVPAFLGNDHYFPRPDVDPDLWETFSQAYLTPSRVILEAENHKSPVLKLPVYFLDQALEFMKAQAKWDPEEDITFGD